MIITRAEAEKLDHAPTRAYLTKVSKYIPRPGYLVDTEKGIMVDTEKYEWKELIRKRADKKVRKSQQGGKRKINQPEIKSPEEKPQRVKEPKPKRIIKTNGSELDDLEEESMRAKLMEPILKNRSLEHKIEMNTLELKKAAGELIEFQLADFLFFGYMERINLELLGITRKIAPIIDNLVKEKKTEDILKRFNREIEIILKEIKAEQEKDIKQWQDERL